MALSSSLAIRLGITKGWPSHWCTNLYTAYSQNDRALFEYIIRKTRTRALKKLGILCSHINIRRGFYFNCIVFIFDAIIDGFLVVFLAKLRRRRRLYIKQKLKKNYIFLATY